ncbi:SOS response-associated peptidase [Maribacter aestuarii]|uniref:SOS response-associated peptidase n=1 Tax=Maribacter aestuarii TaxID=1130723 RepID=UPI00248AF1AA|nr:SOS response-associated peptidase [Maribacter aestuarii]
MCYDIQANLETQLRRAMRDSDIHVIEEIKTKLERLTGHPYYHTTGFKHPKLLIYTNESPKKPVVSQWGLAPYWVKDKKQLYSAWNKTLNARGETIFDLKSFKSSAINRRCIIPVDGFYEHRHYKGKTYPHYIYRKDGEPMNLGGLWREWTDKVSGEILNTFSIVTTTANPMMEKIHNNPAASDEPRMPLILLDELEEKWLEDYEEELAEQAVTELIKPFPEELMDYHTVDRLRGKEYKGNVPEIDEEVEYPELSQQELF